MIPKRIKKTATIASALILFAIGVNLHAYSEDICIDPKSPNTLQVANCWDVGCADYPDAKACPVKGITTYLQATLFTDPATPNRSVLHFDLVWILARMNGISPENALELASYSQAADKGDYTHLSADGQNKVLYDVEYFLDGVARNDLPNGGPWFHFIPRAFGVNSTVKYPEGYLPYNQNATNPFPTEEQALSHIRNWAFGNRVSICFFGMTDLYGNCMTDDSLKVEYSVVSAVYLPVTYKLGLQTLSSDYVSDTGQEWSLATSGSLKAFGIYIHALGDRLSHYKCNESSAIQKKSGMDPRSYILPYDTEECGQINHAWRHYGETGHGSPPPRTTGAIEYYYKEIQSFLSKYPKYKTDNVSSIGWSQAQTPLASAISKGAANERLGALCTLARSWGLGWHDGNASCQYQTLPYSTLPSGAN